MRFFRLVKYDFAQNYRRTLVKWVMAGGVSLLFFLYFFMDVLHIFWSGETLAENIDVFYKQGISIWDSLLYLTGGMLPISFASLLDSFQFPVRWLFPHMLILFFTLNYAKNDLTQGGIQVLSRTNNRVLWWLSKCIWNAMTVLSCFAVELAVWFLLISLSAKTSDSSLNERLFEGIFNASLPEQGVSPCKYMLIFCLLPVMVCVSISLIQMTLTLYMKPVFAYIVVMIYYIAGIYYATPLFLSNYALSVRSSIIGLYNFRPETGLFFCVISGILAVSAGGVRLCKMDLLNYD